MWGYKHFVIPSLFTGIKLATRGHEKISISILRKCLIINQQGEGIPVMSSDVRRIF